MGELKNYREKLKGIENLLDKLESGDLSIHELVELETLTRELHERSIILKYKAFEEADGQRQGFEAEAVIVPKVMIEEPVEVEPPFIDEPIIEPEMEATPVLDFSMFDAQDEEPEVKQEEAPEVSQEEESDVIIDDVQETPVIEAPAAPVVQEEPIAIVREKGSSFLDRLSILDNSISSQLAGRKIDTLTGAFGINERLLYINELFDGSGEAFSDAIKALDTQDNLDAASNKVEELAFQNSWNPEEEVVLEFLAIIKRRYA